MGEDLDKKLLIFLSHASEDKGSVRALCQQLKEDGFDPWLDEERLLPGQTWNLEIKQALQASDAILLCFSSQSVAKPGYIQREFKRAMERMEEKPEGAIFVIPVRLDDCELPQFIRALQYIDYPSGYSRLLTSLQKLAHDLHPSPAGRTTPSLLRVLRLEEPAGPPLLETRERFVTLGRSPKNMVCIQDPEVSWEHGQISLMMDGYVYRHLSRSNPSIIHRRRDAFLLRQGQNEQIVLQNQDRLTLGKTTFVIEFNLIAEDAGYIPTDKKGNG